MKANSDKHEDILVFLEDNISKLVRQKVASRAKYKEYDECFVNYLTAESIDDYERMELYGEILESCHAAMLRKLETAIDEHPELIKNEVVAEYVKLMKSINY